MHAQHSTGGVGCGGGRARVCGLACAAQRARHGLLPTTAAATAQDAQTRRPVTGGDDDRAGGARAVADSDNRCSAGECAVAMPSLFRGYRSLDLSDDGALDASLSDLSLLR